MTSTFYTMSGNDDWNWTEEISLTDISLDDELKGTGEIHLSKKTGKVRPQFDTIYRQIDQIIQSTLYRVVANIRHWKK